MANEQTEKNLVAGEKQNTVEDLIREELTNRVSDVILRIRVDLIDAINHSINDVTLDTNLDDYIEDLILLVIKENNPNKRRYTDGK